MTTQTQETVLVTPPYLRVLLQSVELLQIAENLPTLQQQVVVQASIVNTAFSLEALANSLLSGVKLPKRIENILERRSFDEKIEIYSECARPSHKLLWKHASFTSARELLQLRHAYVHPKVKTEKVRSLLKGDLGKDVHSGKSISAEIVTENDNDKYETLGLSVVPSKWDFQGGVRVLRSSIQFVERLLIDELRHCSCKFQKLLLLRDATGKYRLTRTDISGYHEWLSRHIAEPLRLFDKLAAKKCDKPTNS